MAIRPPARKKSQVIFIFFTKSAGFSIHWEPDGFVSFPVMGGYVPGRAARSVAPYPPDTVYEILC